MTFLIVLPNPKFKQIIYFDQVCEILIIILLFFKINLISYKK